MFGLAAVAAVAAAVVVTVASGRSGPSKEHKAAAAYIEQVDTIQQQMKVELDKAGAAYRTFGSGKPNPALTPELRHAARTLRTLELRLQALPAPDIAAQLRRLVVQLAGAEVALATEVTSLSEFAPRFSALLRQAAAAGARLSHDLAAVAPPQVHTIHGTRKQITAARAKFQAEAAQAAAAQAAAIDAYVAAIGRVRGALEKLTPPPVLEPSYRIQLATFAATSASGATLALELRKQKRANVALLGRRFTVATRTATTIGAQRSQIAAVQAYNRRVRAIGALQTRIQSELARVQSIVG